MCEVKAGKTPGCFQGKEHCETDQTYDQQDHGLGYSTPRLPETRPSPGDPVALSEGQATWAEHGPVLTLPWPLDGGFCVAHPGFELTVISASGFRPGFITFVYLCSNLDEMSRSSLTYLAPIP